MGLLLLIVIVVFPAMTAPAAATAPFFMFTAARFADADERLAIADVLRHHVTERDYLSLRLAEELPELADRVGAGHIYLLAPSLGQIAQHADGNRRRTPGLVIYDGEHWPQTPLSEQRDMVRAIAQGRILARTAGQGAYGIAPDGRFLGIVPELGQYDLNMSIHRHIDWKGITLFDIQAQRLLDSAENPQAGIDTYAEFVAGVTGEVRANSPSTKIVAQLSFRFTPPESMIAAAVRLAGKVDGFYIAYPRNIEPLCTYCSAQNLARVIGALPGRSG
jgi:hypothetical protein